MMLHGDVVISSRCVYRLSKRRERNHGSVVAAPVVVGVVGAGGGSGQGMHIGGHTCPAKPRDALNGVVLRAL